MNKKTTDRIINFWVLKYFFGPSSLLSLSAFAIGYGWPNTLAVVQPIAQWFGLHHLVAVRTFGTDFDSAAYLYWVTFWVTFPLNLIWLHWVGARERLLSALRAVALANLSSGVWDPEKYTLKGGYSRFFFSITLTISLLFFQMLIAREPSYCKGCETSSVLGFILINWVGVHLILVASYVAGAYLVLWKSIRISFGVDK